MADSVNIDNTHIYCLVWDQCAGRGVYSYCMVYLVYGTDRKNGHAAVRDICAAQGGEPQVRVVEAGAFSREVCEEAIAAQAGLFGGVTIFVFEGVLGQKDGEHTELGDYALSRLDDFAASAGVCVFREEKALKPLQKAFEKAGARVIDCGNEAKVEDDFSIFTLSDAVGKRDRKAAWVAFQEAVQHGAKPEAIYGTLLWQMKTIALTQDAVARGGGPEEAGLSPFVFSKAARFGKNYAPQETVAFIGRLVDAYHEARRGGPDLETALELVVLGV